MKTGIWIAVLGVLGVVVGGSLYALDYHKTIGLGGLGLGIVLLIAGLALTMQKEKAAPAQAAGAAQAS